MFTQQDKHLSPDELVQKSLDQGKIRYGLDGVRKGADINARDGEKKTLLMLTAFKPQTSTSMDLMDLLIEKGVNLDAQDRKGDTALHHCAANHNVAAIIKLLEAGANPNIRNRKGFTAEEYLSHNLNGSKRRIAMNAIFNTRAAQAEKAGYTVVQDKRTNNKPHIVMKP